MANSPQARKRAKQNTVRRLLKHSQRSTVRTAIKKLETAITAGDQAAAQEAYKVSVSMIDKANVKGFDIGVGANCIYPILGKTWFGW